MTYELGGKRNWVAGRSGLVGCAVVHSLEREDCDVICAGHDVVDKTNQRAVGSWLADQKPDVIILAAARVGGILTNDINPVDFLYDT